MSLPEPVADSQLPDWAKPRSAKDGEPVVSVCLATLIRLSIYFY